MSAADDKKLGEMLVGCMPTLFAFVRRRVGDRETANEILQEVSLRALAGEGPGIRRTSSPGAAGSPAT